eukprot:425269-Lingulodinium_polyedra.AAC.1
MVVEEVLTRGCAWTIELDAANLNWAQMRDMVHKSREQRKRKPLYGMKRDNRGQNWAGCTVVGM